MTGLLLIKEFPGQWRASLGYYFSTAMRWLNDGDEVPSRGRADLKLAKLYGPNGSDGEVSVTAQSLEGAYPDFHEGNFRREPSLFASVRLTW